MLRQRRRGRNQAAQQSARRVPGSVRDLRRGHFSKHAEAEDLHDGRRDKQINDVEAPLGNVAEMSAERLNDIHIAGATAVTDIDNVIKELQAARDYLQAETERVWRANARYADLAKTASASAKSIAENMGGWRNPAPPSLGASRGSEVQPEVNES